MTLHPIARHEGGFTMMEVLIAIVVLSIGLLGVAGLQANSLRNNNSAFTKSQATLLAMDMADRMRANPVGGPQYNGFKTTDAIATPPNCKSAQCDNENLAIYDKKEWKDQFTNNARPALPGGLGIIAYDAGAQIATIKVLWTDLHYNGTRDTCTDTQTNDQACFSMSFKL